MKSRWDWRAACLTRPSTEPVDPEGVAVLLTTLEESSHHGEFRLVFLGNRGHCVVAWREASGNGHLQNILRVLAEAANLELTPVDSETDWPTPQVVHQLAEPSLETDVPDVVRKMTEKTSVVFAARGGQVFQTFIVWDDTLVELAAGFRVNQPVKNGGNIFVPGLRPRRTLDDGITLADLALGFHLDQLKPERSPVTVRVGTRSGGDAPVFVDASGGHVLILGPANSTVGRRIGNQLALKAVQAGQIVVVVQPQVENLGILAQANPKIISTRMDERTIATWQSRVLVGPGLTVVQGHPGDDALERLQAILKGLWTAAQMESRRTDWPGMTIVINDFIPTASEPQSDSADRRTLPPYRHRLYELLAQMAGSFNAIRLILLGRPKVVFGVENLQAVVGSFGQIVRVRTVAEGYPRGEGYSHDRFEDEEIRQWLHANGAHDRCLVLGSEGWTKTKLGMVEPEVEVTTVEQTQVLGPDEVQQPHRWPTRERRQPTAQPQPADPTTATEPSPSTEDIERLFKATGILPLRPHEREALESLKAEEAKEAKREAARAAAEVATAITRVETETLLTKKEMGALREKAASLKADEGLDQVLPGIPVLPE